MASRGSPPLSPLDIPEIRQLVFSFLDSFTDWQSCALTSRAFSVDIRSFIWSKLSRQTPFSTLNFTTQEQDYFFDLFQTRAPLIRHVVFNTQASILKDYYQQYSDQESTKPKPERRCRLLSFEVVVDQDNMDSKRNQKIMLLNQESLKKIQYMNSIRGSSNRIGQHYTTLATISSLKNLTWLELDNFWMSLRSWNRLIRNCEGLQVVRFRRLELLSRVGEMVDKQRILKERENRMDDDDDDDDNDDDDEHGKEKENQWRVEDDMNIIEKNGHEDENVDQETAVQSKIQELRIHSFGTRIHLPLLRAILQGLGELKTLEIDIREAAMAKILADVLPVDCLQLTDLYLKDLFYTEPTGSALARLLNQFKKLEKFSLNAPTLGMQTLVALEQHGPFLTELNLKVRKEERLLDGHVFGRILATAPNLKIARLEGPVDGNSLVVGPEWVCEKNLKELVLFLTGKPRTMTTAGLELATGADFDDLDFDVQEMFDPLPPDNGWELYRRISRMEKLEKLVIRGYKAERPIRQQEGGLIVSERLIEPSDFVQPSGDQGFELLGDGLKDLKFLQIERYSKGLKWREVAMMGKKFLKLKKLNVGVLLGANEEEDLFRVLKQMLPEGVEVGPIPNEDDELPMF